MAARSGKNRVRAEEDNIKTVCPWVDCFFCWESKTPPKGCFRFATAISYEAIRPISRLVNHWRWLTIRVCPLAMRVKSGKLMIEQKTIREGVMAMKEFAYRCNGCHASYTEKNAPADRKCGLTVLKGRCGKPCNWVGVIKEHQSRCMRCERKLVAKREEACGGTLLPIVKK